MKKRVPALVLALALALTVPAWAAQDTPDNFVRSKTYAGQFSDLTPESTFYDNVAALYAYGLSVGKADGTFGLRDQLTVGQVVIFAGRIRSLYRTGDAEAGPGAYAAENEAAALRYLRYLQAEGVIGTELDESLSPAEKLKVVQGLMAQDDPRAAAVYQSIGVYLGHTLGLYAMFYDIRHVQMMGRVMSGKGGDIIMETASRVMDEEYPDVAFRPEAPDEKTRRVGQSAAAASLPELK